MFVLFPSVANSMMWRVSCVVASLMFRLVLNVNVLQPSVIPDQSALLNIYFGLRFSSSDKLKLPLY